MTRRRRSRGQSLVIFALSFTALLGFAGLAVDALRAFDLYARMQRAAEAGALAAALYMPTYYNTVRPGDVDSAISRASKEVVKNGFGVVLAYNASACPNPVTAIEVAVCQVTGRTTDVRVTITERLDLALLGTLGIQAVTISASAEAGYVDPVGLGSVENYIGDAIECSPGNSENLNADPCALNASGNHLSSFLENIDGPAELKDAGDPTVYCAEGPATPDSTQSNAGFSNGEDPGSVTNPNPLYTYNGNPTNHPQWKGIAGGPTSQGAISTHCGTAGNPDHQPPGYSGPATSGTANPGGYNYVINVDPSLGDVASVWVYNPGYIPQDAGGTPVPLDHFLDPGTAAPAYYQGPLGEGIGNRFDGVHHDAPLFFFTTTFTIYAVANVYDRSQDTQKSTVQYAPYDATTADLAAHGCVDGQLYNPLWNGADTANTYHKPTQVNRALKQGCVAAVTAPCWLNWCKVSPAGGLAAGQYRLVVEATGLQATALNAQGQPDYTSGATDGYGQHAYAIRVCQGDALTYPGSGCKNGSPAKGAGEYNNPLITIAAWNNLDVAMQAPLMTRNPNGNYPQSACAGNGNTPYACMDVACIPASMAGRTVTIGFFDMGDGTGTGNVYMGVVPPAAGATITYPAALQSTLRTVDGKQVVVVATNGYRPYHGLWIPVTITLPPTYDGVCGPGRSSWSSGDWQLLYAADSTFTPNDRFGISFNLIGSPVHLVQS